jgi:pSer/pThr/pTyr-binding forkhead associated (FHA) protein
MTAKLVVQVPGGQYHDFPLRQRVTTIGRAPTCDLVLEYGYMSRLHARLELTESGYMVVDAGSKFGSTLLKRQRIPNELSPQIQKSKRVGPSWQCSLLATMKSSPLWLRTRRALIDAQ